MDHPEIQWDWKDLSANPGIPLAQILARRDLPWNWRFVGLSKVRRLRDILDHLDLRWDVKEVIVRQTLDDLLDHAGRLPWRMPTTDPGMFGVDFILHKSITAWRPGLRRQDYPDYVWLQASSQMVGAENLPDADMNGLSLNRTLTPAYIHAHADTRAWNWAHVSANPFQYRYKHKMPSILKIQRAWWRRRLPTRLQRLLVASRALRIRGLRSRFIVAAVLEFV